MRVLLDFDFDDIDKLVTYAKENVITEKMLYEIKLGRAEYSNQHHLQSNKFDLWYSIEEQPIAGMCQHITLAKTIPLTVNQNYEVIEELLNVFYLDRDDVKTIKFDDNSKMHIFAEIK